ncbi:MAG TPA: hypothetical protein EYP57_00200 [Thermodesulfobacteriaceae bacterium]|nr:hypothetical protein [Thermodesulfobacteriaceae bacterium]
MDICTVITESRGVLGNLVDHVTKARNNTEDYEFSILEHIHFLKIPGCGTVVSYPFRPEP